jgi:hypothetical protein
MSKLFPKSANRLPLQIVIYLCLVGGIASAGIDYYATNKYANVGYAPVQPVPYSHALHAGQLGIDCRYCHSNVEKSGFANLPTAQTCMNCHSQVKADSPLLAVVRKSYESDSSSWRRSEVVPSLPADRKVEAAGEPVPWVQIHMLPDYVYFNHSVHVTRGISCVECHGRIDTMDVVDQEKSLSMGFCLDCHRAPEEHLRDLNDPAQKVTNLGWLDPKGEAHQIEQGTNLVKKLDIHPPTSCSGCHR